MTRRSLTVAAALAGTLACMPAPAPVPPADAGPDAANVYKIEEGYVDVGGVFIYYKALGTGAPLVLLHGGPGASHDYLLPYLIPLAKTNRLIFIDERGSGKSTKLDDPKGYTVENMADDVEAVRKALKLGKVSMLGHSYGGVLAQAYALKYQDNLTHLILASTFHSTRQLNDVFKRMMAAMTPELRSRIEGLEKAGLYGHGLDFEKNRYAAPYMVAAWGEGYFPYLYRRHPDANYDPSAGGDMSWDLYREMWGSHGEFVIDGNLASVEYAERLGGLHVPTLITVGDHDESDPSIARDMQRCIAGSKLVVLPDSGHMTFVDQPEMFLKAVDDFVNGRS
jgi:proline iminopeptidase